MMPIDVVVYSPQRLADFAGVLQADAFGGYVELYRGGTS